MPSISVSKICIPFSGSGVDWVAYWASLISATVENIAPTHVVMTFPTAHTSLGATDFTVTVNAANRVVSSASWTGAVLTLVLASAVVYGDVIVVTFVTTGGTANVTNNVLSAGEVLIRAGNTVGWYDFTDATTLTVAGGLVSLWKDKLLSGRDLVAAGTARPTLGATGIVFNGTTNFMKAAAFVYNQPATIYFVGRQITWSGGQMIFYGDVVNKLSLSQSALYGTPSIDLTANNNTTNKLVLNTFGIVRCIFNAASSYIQVNNEAGDGGSCGAATFDGFTLGARYDGAAGHSNIEVKEIVCRTVSDSAGNQTDILNYLNAKYTIF
jgi:hypothetical protein